VATAEVRDDEMRHRVEHHRRRRGDDWKTIECPLDLVSLLADLRTEGKPVLVDCLTLWMSNLLHRDDTTPPESIIHALGDELRRTTYPLVLVTNEVGCGIVPDNALARRFRDLAGFANQSIAEASRRVTFVAAGLPLRLK
jgi:adenosylcobinamide kinase/adenosylcobinamide-phosphate guanylyltransferase